MADKRGEIIQAAKGLFSRQGYGKTSVDDISQAVGMKKSSLYYYFKNKEDLFMCSFKNEWEAQFRMFENEANKAPTADLKIFTYIEHSLKYYEQVVVDHKIPVKVLIETRNLYREFMNSINEERICFYERCIQEGIQEGLFKECDIRKVAESIFTVKFAIQYDQFNLFINSFPTHEDWISIQDQILFVIQLILEGLRVK